MEALRIWVRNMEKKEIRKYVFQKRKELTEKECVEKSQQICEKILQMESFQKAEWVYAVSYTHLEGKYDPGTECGLCDFTLI